KTTKGSDQTRVAPDRAHGVLAARRVQRAGSSGALISARWVIRRAGISALGYPARWNQRAGFILQRSALGVLEALAGTRLPVLLALLLAIVARQEARALQRLAALGIFA